MLRRLSVENYALIDKLEMELDPHLNIITGETGAGFRGDTNKVTFIDRSGREELPLMPKSEVAERIADKIESLLK